MVKRIEDLLHRRNDLSTFLVHLTRDQPAHSARDNLLDILGEQVIEARSAMGLGSRYWPIDVEFERTQMTVCFTETPLEHVWMMSEEIGGRSVQMKPYGVVFTKSWARRKGVNPVMYVDITPGHDWLTTPINQMLEAAAAGKTGVKVNDEWVSVGLAQSPVARLAPFIEPMGTNQVRREWWWEREWRKVGHLSSASAEQSRASTMLPGRPSRRTDRPVRLVGLTGARLRSSATARWTEAGDRPTSRAASSTVDNSKPSDDVGPAFSASSAAAPAPPRRWSIDPSGRAARHLPILA